MITTICTFFISFFICYGLIKYQHLHNKVSSDNDLSGPQKFHTHAVPRVGGLAIILALLTISGCSANGILFWEGSGLLLKISLCALPAFTVGFVEDLTKKMGVKVRLIATSVSASMSVYYLNVTVAYIQVPGVDWILSFSVISILFTVIAITGLANAYNIIDGFNGLASMVAILSLSAITCVAFQANDPILTSICITVIGAIGGFFIFNYPRGDIFLGDGGAYLIGYLIAIISILLVIRNPIVSPWFALLVNAYPIFETLFTIWRRKVHQGKNPGLPDGLHFHSLIYRRMIRYSADQKKLSHTKNAKTSPYLWFLSSLALVPAIIWWQTTWVLQFFVLIFCISYILAYKSLVEFKTPSIFKLPK